MSGSRQAPLLRMGQESLEHGYSHSVEEPIATQSVCRDSDDDDDVFTSDSEAEFEADI